MKFLTIMNTDDMVEDEFIQYVFDKDNFDLVSICPSCDKTNAEPYESKQEGIFFSCDDCDFSGIGKFPITECSYEDSLIECPNHKELLDKCKNDSKTFLLCDLVFITKAIPAHLLHDEEDEERNRKLFDEHGIDVNSYNVFNLLEGDETVFDYYYLDNTGEMYIICD